MASGGSKENESKEEGTTRSPINHHMWHELRIQCFHMLRRSKVFHDVVYPTSASPLFVLGVPPAYEAVRWNDRRLLRLLLLNSANPANFSDDFSDDLAIDPVAMDLQRVEAPHKSRLPPLLYVAVRMGHVDMVQYLLEISDLVLPVVPMSGVKRSKVVKDETSETSYDEVDVEDYKGQSLYGYAKEHHPAKAALLSCLRVAVVPPVQKKKKSLPSEHQVCFCFFLIFFLFFNFFFLFVLQHPKKKKNTSLL